MKLASFLLIVAFHVSAAGVSQITLSEKNAPLEKVFSAIERQSGYVFFYDYAWLDGAKKVTFQVKNVSLTEALNKCFKDQPLTYSIIGKTIVVKQTIAVGKIRNVEIAIPAMPPPRVITGTITDENGKPLAGVSILVKGTSIGTTTDENGMFSLEVPGNDAALVVSYVGYTAEETIVGTKTDFNISLRPLMTGVDEVVVVGYGTQKKSDLTSSISEIKTENLKNLPVSTSGSLIQGRASGVLVNENNGAPGSSPSIRIHGISSINANIEPLIVIDGFPVGTNIPQGLAPNDIASISILKDASSTSIYGSRGANGVILIQTNKGNNEISQVNYNFLSGMHYVPRGWRPKVLDAYQYAQYNIERTEELNNFSGSNNPIPDLFQDVVNNPDKYGKGTDWLNETLREGSQAIMQRHNISFSSGNKNVREYISGEYFGDNGVLPNTSFRRYSIRSNVEGRVLNDRVKMNVTLNGTRTENKLIQTDRMWGIVMKSIVASPLQKPYDVDGNLIPFLPADVPGYFSMANPLFEARESLDKVNSDDFYGGINLEIKIINNLNFETRFFTHLMNENGKTFTPSTIGTPAIGTSANLKLGSPPFPNNREIQNRSLFNWQLDNLLKYNKSFEKNNLDVLMGYTSQRERGDIYSINAVGFPDDVTSNFLEASSVTSDVRDYSNWALAAFFGRINYGFDGRYLVELNFRREGSSRFGENNKYGNFPSGSVGWNIFKEKFYSSNAFVKGLRIRGSYGRTGNSGINDYDRLGRLISVPDVSNVDNNFNYVVGDNIVTGKSLVSLGNSDLKWETSDQLDFGLEFTIFNNKLNFTLDYYRKVTKDMLFNVSIPTASGFSSARLNTGSMLNKGFDIEISSFLNFKKVSWNSNLNLTFVKNVVTSLPEGIDRIVSEFNITQVGLPVGGLYGFKYDGLFNTQRQVDDPNLLGWTNAKELGAFIYEDINGDGTIDGRDQTYIGNPHPKVILGFNNSFRFQNFILAFTATGAFGYKIQPKRKEWLYNEKGRWNVSSEFLNRWRSVDDVGDGVIPSILWAGQHNAGDQWLESGDHLWIKDITLTYDFPNVLLKRFNYFKGLKAYFNVHNAIRVTKYSGWNPSVSTFGGSNAQTMGVDDFSYPIDRAYSIGVNVNL